MLVGVFVSLKCHNEKSWKDGLLVGGFCRPLSQALYAVSRKTLPFIYIDIMLLWISFFVEQSIYMGTFFC